MTALIRTFRLELCSVPKQAETHAQAIFNVLARWRR